MGAVTVESLAELLDAEHERSIEAGGDWLRRCVFFQLGHTIPQSSHCCGLHQVSRGACTARSLSSPAPATRSDIVRVVFDGESGDG